MPLVDFLSVTPFPSDIICVGEWTRHSNQTHWCVNIQEVETIEKAIVKWVARPAPLFCMADGTVHLLCISLQVSRCLVHIRDVP